MCHKDTVPIHYDTETRFKEGEEHPDNHENGHCKAIWAEAYTAGPTACAAWAKGRQMAISEDGDASAYDGCSLANACFALKALDFAYRAELDEAESEEDDDGTRPLRASRVHGHLSVVQGALQNLHALKAPGWEPPGDTGEPH